MDELGRDGGDPVIGRVIGTLRRPEDLGAGIDRRVLDALRAPRPQLARRLGPGPAALIGGLAIAAGLGAVLLFPTPAPAPATTPVRFAISAGVASQVAVVGDFNDWNPAGTPLRRVDGIGEWSVTVPLHPGRYRFSFLLDGSTWVPDPNLPRAPDPDYGTPTSVLTVEPSSQ